MSNLEKKSQKENQNRDRENKSGRENWNISILLPLQCRSHFQGMQFTRHLLGDTAIFYLSTPPGLRVGPHPLRRSNRELCKL